MPHLLTGIATLQEEEEVMDHIFFSSSIRIRCWGCSLVVPWWHYLGYYGNGLVIKPVRYVQITSSSLPLGVAVVVFCPPYGHYWSPIKCWLELSLSATQSQHSFIPLLLLLMVLLRKLRNMVNSILILRWWENIKGRLRSLTLGGYTVYILPGQEVSPSWL